MIRAVWLLAIYVCRSMLHMITCRFHGFCIAANESMSEWKPSSPSMAAASKGMSSEAVIAGSQPGISSPTAGTGSGAYWTVSHEPVAPLFAGLSLAQPQPPVFPGNSYSGSRR